MSTHMTEPPQTHDRVQRGGWQGRVLDGIECYYGMRYAQLDRPEHPRGAAVASAGPQQLNVQDLTAVPVFAQLPSRLEAVTGPGGRLNPQSRDAFFLNVWTPQAAKRLPVLVFVHGGAWASGGGAMRWYRGQRLAAEGMVVVTLNYRLGPDGHLAGESAEGSQAAAHQPLGDLVLALRWVREHIGALGGDPDQVTLAGQSAGAWYAWALASLPMAAGLLRQVALLSIPHISPWTAAYRTDFTQRTLALAQEAATPAPCQALLHAGVQVLAQAPRTPGAMPAMYLPTLTPQQAQLLADADSAAQHMHAAAMYVRTTQHEMSAFLPPEARTVAGARALLHAMRLRPGAEHAPRLNAPSHWPRCYAEAVGLSSWLAFGQFAHQIAQAAARQGRTVVVRDFAAQASTPYMGAVHCMDLPFQFGNFDDWADAPILADCQRTAFELLSATVRADLAAFVHGRYAPQPKTLGSAPATAHP